MYLKKPLAIAAVVGVALASVSAAWLPACNAGMTSDAEAIPDMPMAGMTMPMSDAPPADTREPAAPDGNDCPFGPIASCVSAAVLAGATIHDFGGHLGNTSGPAFTATLHLDILASNLFHPPRA